MNVTTTDFQYILADLRLARQLHMQNDLVGKALAKLEQIYSSEILW